MELTTIEVKVSTVEGTSMVEETWITDVSKAAGKILIRDAGKSLAGMKPGGESYNYRANLESLMTRQETLCDRKFKGILSIKEA